MAVTLYKPPTYLHDPQAVLDYPIGWTDYLEDINDTIMSATVTVTDGPDDDLQINDFDFTTAAGTPRISYSGGAIIPSEKYTVTMHIVMASGQEDDRSIFIKIKER